MKGLYERLLEGINDGIAMALTRKPIGGISGDEIDVRPPEDSSSFSKHSRDWYPLHDFLQKSPKDVGDWADVEHDFIRDFLNDHPMETMPGDCVGEIDAMFPPGSVSRQRFDAMLRIDEFVHHSLTMKHERYDFVKHDVTPEQADYINTVLHGIKSVQHPLYAVYSFSDERLYNFLYSLFSKDHNISVNSNLNWINVSRNVSFNELFYTSKFDGDISLWRLDSAENLHKMFGGSHFSGNISKWKFPKVRDLSEMFHEAHAFNGAVGDGKFPMAETMKMMFRGADMFNHDVSKWEMPNVRDFSAMFALTNRFNKPLDGWTGKIGSAETMRNMFYRAKKFASPLFDLPSTVTDIAGMFALMNTDATFPSIGAWNVGNVRNMSCLFQWTKLRCDLAKWDVSNVEDMTDMFRGSHFYTDIDGIYLWGKRLKRVRYLMGMFAEMQVSVSGDMSGWRLPSAEILEKMFSKTCVKADMHGWVLRNVTSMDSIFEEATIMGNVSGWRLPSVTSMKRVLKKSSVSSYSGGTVAGWKFPNVTDMTEAFAEASGADISDWDVSGIEHTKDMFKDSNIRVINSKSKTL